MQIMTSSYLTAGLSVVAAGAIIATPMSRPTPQQEPSHPLVRNEQVQLAASTVPFTLHNVAGNSGALHVLADVSRAFQSAKTANAASAVGAISASPSVARTTVAQPAAAAAIPSQADAAQSGAVTTQDLETADTPNSDEAQSSTAGSPVANAFDPPGVANVLASAAQLAIDTFIGIPGDAVARTVGNVDRFFFDVATLDPNMISAAFSDFFANEANSLQMDGGFLGDDVQQLQNSIGHLFGVDDGDDSATALAAAKTATKPGATAASAAAGAADETTAKQRQDEGPGAGSIGVVTGKHSQDAPTKPAKANTPGQKDDTTAVKQSGGESKDQSNSSATETTSDTKSQTGKGGGTSETATGNESVTRHDVTKPSGSSQTETKKPGNTSSASASNQSTSKKADHAGGQSSGKKAGGKKAGGNKSHGHKG